MIGKLFNNRYQIIEKLGAGGTAIVYRGQDMLLNRMVTVKILREEFVSNQDLVRRFRHEAQAVASLSHPNIVSVYDVGFEENMQYIVMEFVEGESLKEYIKRKGVLKLAESCNIITQILAGVQHAHEHGIVHRDIKPHNILLGRDGRAKVTDFGIAVGMSDVTMTYNTSSRIMGSVHYISPEQVQGMNVTEKSDIYSVGVVFYEMLTGRVPFVGETPISIAMQHVQGELILPHQINPQVPVGISYVVMRAMRKNPETRYASAAEMSEAVFAAYQGLLDGNGDENISNADEAHGVQKAPLKVKPISPVVDKAEQFSDPPPEKPERKLNGSRIALLAGAVVLLAIIIWVLQMVGNIFPSGNEEVVVPHLVGESQQAAEATLTDLGLVPSIVPKSSTTVAEGLVISQSVAAESKVSPGRTIVLEVSSGVQKVLVPNLVGSTQRLAEMNLSNLGLTATITTEYNEDVDKDRVIFQSPSEGYEIPLGSSVELLVSLGPEPKKFIMENLIGMTRQEAYAYIEEHDLVIVSETPATSYEYEAGRITAQSIPDGNEATTGDSIELVYSEGPGPTEKEYTFYYHLGQDYNDDGRPVEVVHTVVVLVSDSQGEREVFNEQLLGDSYVTCDFVYYNEAVVTLLIDGQTVQTIPIR